jgi:proteasome component ECM29
MWKSLVTNPKKTVDQYLKEIMKELVENVTSDLWRVRQACCDALTDIYSGRRFAEMEEFIAVTLEKLFRVSDDVKETSQKAAIQCLKHLTTFLSKCCNPIYTPKEEVDRALKLILNILLEKGILFPTDFIRGYSLENVQSIVKVSKSHIKPFIANVISTLLQQMSVLEPSMFNYVQNMRNEEKELNAQLEKIRVQMASSGPISQIIIYCQNYIDDEVMIDLVPRLLEIMKAGVGLPTRIGCAKLLGELAKFNGSGMKPYVKQLIKMILSTIKSTSVSSSEKSSLAKTLPDIIKLGKTSDGKLMIKEIVEMYQNNTDSEIQYTSGVITLYLANNVMGIISHFFPIILPTVFIGRHDENEKVSQIWGEVWNELAITGTKNLLLKYLDDVVKECQTLLDHSSWKMKKQGALGFKELAEILETEIPLEMREFLIDFLIKKLVNSLNPCKLFRLVKLGMENKWYWTPLHHFQIMKTTPTLNQMKS